MKIDLPSVYQDSYQLSLSLLQRSRNFPKAYRPTLARRLEERSLDLCMTVRKMLLASSKKSPSVKSALIEESSHAVDDLKFLWQMSRDLGLITASTFGVVATSLADVGAQVGGLRRK